MIQKELENKIKNFKNKEEYLDALMYFDVNHGEKTFRDYKDSILEKFLEIKEQFGNIITAPRMNYAIMKNLNVNQYDAQRLIRYAIERDIVKFNIKMHVEFC